MNGTSHIVTFRPLSALGTLSGDFRRFPLAPHPTLHTFYIWSTKDPPLYAGDSNARMGHAFSTSRNRAVYIHTYIYACSRLRSRPVFDTRARCAARGIHLSGECEARVRDISPTACAVPIPHLRSYNVNVSSERQPRWRRFECRSRTGAREDLRRCT